MLLRSRPTNRCRILIYHAAGNPTTGVSCRIGHVVILAVLDYHSGAVGLKDGIGLGSIDHDRRIDQSDFERAVWRSMRVRHVAGMSWPCHDTVVRVARIEARARRVERGGSLAHGMNVNGMLTRRHSLDRELAQNPGRGLQKNSADVLTACVLQHRIGRLGGGGNNWRGRQQDGHANGVRAFQNVHALGLSMTTP